MAEEVVYTTTPLGAVLLILSGLATGIAVAGLITGITGLITGGLALFGVVFTVTVITPAAQ